MLLFKRIFSFCKDESPANRREDRRYCIGPRFPLRSVLNLAGHDALEQTPAGENGAGRDWAGRLINISRTGARMQLPRSITARRGDHCILKLDLEGHLLELAGRVAHMTERRDCMDFGLVLEPVEAGSRATYDQFIELIALGAMVRPSKPSHPHDADYLVEQYEGGPGACLDVWRSCTGNGVAAFEFRLHNYRVRGLAGQHELEYLPASETSGEREVAPEQSAEIRRLFHWVVPNLPTTVPADVRDFLLHYAV
jgi:hypothetical protein